MDTYTHTRQTTKETFFTVAPFSSIFEKLKESFFYKLYKISFDASAFWYELCVLIVVCTIFTFALLFWIVSSGFSTFQLKNEETDSENKSKWKNG